MITVKVNGKDYKFKFTIWTIEKVCDMRGIELGDYDKFMKSRRIIGMNMLFRAGLERGTDGKVILNEYEMDELVEKMGRDDVYKIYNHYLDSVAQIVKDYNPQEVKKK
jgi:hypothetical protein